ncbi:hypothetical protein HOY80DRAFT_1134904 [Tuber brumale]|nr:hypothetical protein HOY80DRAFT_1134904 [Tuber brumale]
MSGLIFKAIKDAIKTRSPDLLIFRGVDPKDFAHVMEGLRHPTNYREQYSFRIHWFAADKILNVVMPTKLHECAAAWLLETIQRGLARGVIPEIWVDTMNITPSPAEFPSVVLESGWIEPVGQLHRDATLWQQGSGGQVRVVIQVKHFQRNENWIGARLWITRANPQGGSSEILTAVNDPDGSPTIAYNEFFAGNCPPGIDTTRSIVLDLERLRLLAREEILALDQLPLE